jgi:CelD/BcsL family acetyltransferase involved in cellulose biosynthesis
MVGEEIAASLFALRYRGHYLLLMHCFEFARWGTRSPGVVIIDSAITAEIESDSTYFDFTVGDHSYKSQFGVQEKVLYSLEQGLSPLGRVFAALRRTRSFVGKQLRRLPPEYLPRRLQE